MRYEVLYCHVSLETDVTRLVNRLGREFQPRRIKVGEFLGRWYVSVEYADARDQDGILSLFEQYGGAFFLIGENPPDHLLMPDERPDTPTQRRPQTATTVLDIVFVTAPTADALFELCARAHDDPRRRMYVRSITGVRVLSLFRSTGWTANELTMLLALARQHGGREYREGDDPGGGTMLLPP